jgi:hypothetical protein
MYKRREDEDFADIRISRDHACKTGFIVFIYREVKSFPDAEKKKAALGEESREIPKSNMGTLAEIGRSLEAVPSCSFETSPLEYSMS